MRKGDHVIIAARPLSKNLEGHAYKFAVVVKVISDTIAEIQIEGMSKVGRRRAFRCDLSPSGQLRMF